MSNDNSLPAEPKELKIRVGAYFALFFAIVFFSGVFGPTSSATLWVASQIKELHVQHPGLSHWLTDWIVPLLSTIDFTTLNGSFGKILTGVTQVDNALKATNGTYRGTGGSGAMEGFLFAFGLIPSVMFALAMINVLEHYGALNAARKLLSIILRPLLGIPGVTGLAIIGSLQSTDVGASLTRALADEQKINAKEKEVLTMFQFSGGAMITNFFSSGAVLFTLVLASGELAVPTTIGACIGVIFIMKIVGANIMRLYLTTFPDKDEQTQQQSNATTQK
ncbi:nucleoside recognition domain-containing protein [Limnobaculum parvum]|uniref:YjiH family protein n=1 Tax=Limnobaculum parvum TaxID=2172103 RepID=A0A2Y9TWR8_9GAMM|nr:nucleoside recognition domain-containing protein [Limnobaculum parvum]AWH87949.1 YjiH family protein [Limnobaculum parvum]